MAPSFATCRRREPTFGIVAHDFEILARQLIGKIPVSGSRSPGTIFISVRSFRQTSRACSRQQGGYAMWTTLFAVSFVISAALGLAAIAMNSTNGGRFRL
jgi:hypothetical protein